MIMTILSLQIYSFLSIVIKVEWCRFDNVVVIDTSITVGKQWPPVIARWCPVTWRATLIADRIIDVV